MNLIKKIENNTSERKSTIISIFEDSFMYLNTILLNFNIKDYIFYVDNLTINTGIVNYTYINGKNNIGDDILIYKDDNNFEYAKITAKNGNEITFEINNDYVGAKIIGQGFDYNFLQGIENYIYCEIKKNKIFQTKGKDISWKVLDRSYSEKTIQTKTKIDFCEISKTFFAKLTNFIKTKKTNSEIGGINFLIN